jgi:hypothetical protein
VSWDQRLDRPVALPDGKILRTLEDVRLYILALPRSEHETTAWQVAIEALVLAAGVHGHRRSAIPRSSAAISSDAGRGHEGVEP